MDIVRPYLWCSSYQLNIVCSNTEKYQANADGDARRDERKFTYQGADEDVRTDERKAQMSGWRMGPQKITQRLDLFHKRHDHDMLKEVSHCNHSYMLVDSIWLIYVSEKSESLYNLPTSSMVFTLPNNPIC